MSRDSPFSPAVASIVIPAYNEGQVLGRCLEALLNSQAGPLEIIVAANGCTDNTIEIARTFTGVTILKVPITSKIAALNAGDQSAHFFPRIFLDADIVLGPGSLKALVESLSVPEARVGSPLARFITSSSSLPVRLFYEAYSQLPYVRSGMIGLGVYGLSQEGRKRFDAFPQVQADDLFVQRLFAPEERLAVNGYFEIQAPRDLRNLLKVRTRVAKGNADLAAAEGAANTRASVREDFGATTSQTLRGLAAAVRAKPSLLPAAAVYVGVTLAARGRASSTPASWHRDDSTR